MFVIFSPTLSSFPSHSQSKPKPLKWPVRSYVICPPQYFSSFKLTILLSSHTGLSVAPQTQKAHHFLYLERSSHPQIVIRLTTSLPLYLCSNSAFSETSFHGPSKAQHCLVVSYYPLYLFLFFFIELINIWHNCLFIVCSPYPPN